MGRLKIIRMCLGMFGTNCYFLLDAASGEGYIIDPGAEARKILDQAGSAGINCRGVLCTHGHMDHVGATGKVAQALNAPVYISPPDAGILSGNGRGLTRVGSLLVSRPQGIEFLDDGDTMDFNEHTVKVLSTPGHTIGSLSFLCDSNLFCGDLIFQGSVGRTDLKGGSMSQLLESVRDKVWTLPPATEIYPGHGPSTTVEVEKATNPFLRDLERKV